MTDMTKPSHTDPRCLLALMIGLCLTLVTVFGAGPLAAQQTYGLRAGDTLRVEVLEDPSLNRNVLVAPDGRISFPQAGTLSVSGRTIDAVQGDLVGRLAPSFAAPPTVFVSLEKLAEREVRPIVQAPPAPPAEDPVISVYIVGEANKLGKIDVAPGTTVLQMFAIMGGFTKFAATKRVQLRRADARGIEQVYTLNYPAIEAGVISAGRSTLADGDVIVVPQRHLFE
ncbi:polysaccharide export outer membrane protein [Loktanella atrilutea]|uniref:Polysaccharide export outer membrane protein n=1 Tax=Loktanella atrilutea TaxID=366533 RepID=A0A1M5F5N0_LOKAT|nr:polysaccharide biosynthesis/export family protein [Loktanella atrilutea]SHF86765.1 polysaccharide export outer membrane protein [Loktanella atrilutea]